MEIINIEVPEGDNALHFSDSDGAKYIFSFNLELVDSRIKWLFENTTERFVILGTSRIYFESSVDALAFKLRWM